MGLQESWLAVVEYPAAALPVAALQERTLLVALVTHKISLTMAAAEEEVGVHCCLCCRNPHRMVGLEVVDSVLLVV